tara:strand:+ start:985 stop:1548 length:564 start_codon:yes stop_codon:yes gene_type:complete
MAIIPGQSLTAEPKNAPYENPPQMTEPEEAVFWHLERLAGKTDDVLDSLELGLDVVTMTEGILRAAVMQGRHSVDVSLIIAPIIHEFIKGGADRAGIDYEEGFPDDSKDKRMVKYMINSKKARKLLDEYEEKTGETTDFLSGETDTDEQEEMMPVEGMMDNEAMMSEEPTAPTGGLMSRPSTNEGAV